MTLLFLIFVFIAGVIVGGAVFTFDCQREIRKLRARQVTKDVLSDFIDEVRNDYNGVYSAYWTGQGPNAECVSDEITDDMVEFTIDCFLEEMNDE